MDVLVKMSVSGAVLIAVIVIVRALAVNRLPKKAFLWLWAAAFFCLMIPVRLPSPISVYRPSGQLERLAVRRGCFCRRLRARRRLKLRGPRR